MRPLEFILIVSLAAVSASWFVPLRSRRRLFPVLAMGLWIVLVAHVVTEGHRWPMVPAYGLATLLTLVALWSWRHPAETKSTAGGGRRMVGGIMSLLAVVVAAAAPTLVPHVWLPEPTGPYRVGTTNLFLVDHDRPETFTPDPNDRREIAGRIWYPAAPSAKSKPVPYMENAAEVSQALTRSTPFPSFLFAHLGRVRAHAHRDVGVAQGENRFPVVIFNHAYWAGVPQSTALMEELASHGYVAVSVGHAFETPYFIRPDGRVQAFDPRNHEFAERGRERIEAHPIQQQLTTTSDVRELEALIREVSRRRPKTVESLHIWVADVSAVLDELERWNEGDGPFAGRLDTGRVAVMGHSFGGAAAGQACLDDPRCKAGINFDGLQIGEMLDRPLETPFLFFHHDNAGARNRAPNRPFFQRAQATTYLVIVAGTGHLSFSDLCLQPRTSLFRLAAPVGTIDGRRCQTIVNECVLAFLDRHLQGRDTAPLEDLSERFPEIDIQVQGPDQMR